MKKMLLLLSMLCAFIAACGGGGGSSLSGPGSGSPGGSVSAISAADGAAMAYGVVSINSLVDSTSYSGTADVNGELAIPSSGVTYPAIVKVQSLSGGKVNYGYVASSSQAKVPVNPLTTLVLSIASGGNPASITGVGQLGVDSLASAKTAVNAIFGTIFRAFSVAVDTDLLTTAFPTNHTGLDLILDVLNVKFDALGHPTVCAKLFNTCKTFDLANLDKTPLSITAGEVVSLTSLPLAACSASIKALTSSAITSDASLYASDFLNSGLDAFAYRQAMAARFGNLAANFNNPIFIGKDANNNFVFAFDYFNASSNQYVGTFTMPFKMSGNSCVMAGDQLPFWIQVTSQITMQTRVDGTNDPAVTTASPIRGLVFRAGGDGFGGTSVQNTVDVNGSPVTIQTLQFFMCDSDNVCTRPLMEMTKGSGNNGYYYTPNPNRKNTIPALSYTDAGIPNPAAFYNGNPNPILVKMLDKKPDESQTVLKEVRLKIRGGYISAAEMRAIDMPAVTNAQSILGAGTTLVNPTLNISVPNGVVVQGLSLASGLMTGQVTSTSKFVMSGSTTTMVVPRTIDSGTSYRSIQLNANTVSGTPIWIKYVWSPECSGCS